MTLVDIKEGYVTVAGAQIQMLRGGSGPPVLYLHSIEGNLGWLPWMERVAETATVYAPTHPGFGASDRPEWMESVADVARFYLWMLQEMGLESVSLIGHFLGGWIAAEMAVMSPGVLDRLVLVDAGGVRPRTGEIADVFLLGEDETTRLAFHNASTVPGYADLFEREFTPGEREIRFRNREMTTRLCWKPYMYDRSLISLLPRLNVPTLVVWGAEDRIAPLDAGHRIHEAIPESHLEVIPECGHLPHIEKPEEFSRIVIDHLSASAGNGSRTVN